MIGSIKGIWRYMLSGLVGGVYLVCFLLFGQYYYGGQYTTETHPLPFFDTLVAEGVAFVEADEELRQKRTYMEEDFIYFLASALPSPYGMEYVNDPTNYGNYHFHMSEEIEEDCNYIVRDICADYKEDLRQKGFQEVEYQGYSLFYFKESPSP